MEGSDPTQIISVSHVEIVPVDSYLDPGLLGRVTFVVNGFIWFMNLTIYQSGKGVRIKFPTAREANTPSIVVSLAYRDDIRREIERQVAEALALEEVAR